MKQQKTVESRVLEILKECPMSRYDDMLLILHYYNQYGYIPAGNLPLEDIVFNYRAYGLPCFETIRRARQRVQSLFPEYSRNPQKEEQSGSISIVINITALTRSKRNTLPNCSKRKTTRYGLPFYTVSDTAMTKS